MIRLYTENDIEKMYGACLLYTSIDNNIEENFENKHSDNEDVESEKTFENVSLDKEEENIFLNEFTSSCSPILKVWIRDEGFNYDINGEIFTIYFTNNLYYQFLEGSKAKIKEILKNVSGRDFTIKVSSIDKKKSNKNNSIRESKNDSNDDVMKKLEKVFEMCIRDRDKRVDAITSFVKEAREMLQAYDTPCGIDVFGYSMQVGKAGGIGQDFKEISNQADVMSSMIYPSHWGLYSCLLYTSRCV